MEAEYNLYFKDEFVNTFTEKQISEIFKISRSEVMEYAEENRKYNGKWLFKTIYDKKINKNTIPGEMWEEWETVTKRLRTILKLKKRRGSK